MPARQQYKDHVQYRVDLKAENPHVMRVALVGPRARDLSDELGGNREPPQRHSYDRFDYFYKNSGHIEAPSHQEYASALRVGLFRKTFSLKVGTVQFAAFEQINWPMVDCIVICCDSKTTPAVVQKVISRCVAQSHCVVVCGPAPKMEFDSAYPLQKELWGRYCDKTALLKRLNDEKPEYEVSLPQQGIPYVCTDNSVTVLRCILAELTFRLRVNRSLGRSMARIVELKTQKGITDEQLSSVTQGKEGPHEGPHEEHKCTVS